jgi:hypothetical protein
LYGQLIAQPHDAGHDGPTYAIGVHTARQSHVQLDDVGLEVGK